MPTTITSEVYTGAHNEAHSPKTSLKLLYRTTPFLAGEGVQKIFSTTTLTCSIVL
jgi:hypothetical protein